MKNIEVLIIGASAAGLMCAISAGYRGRSVLVLDHAKKAGSKILISGGGRCNFTNTSASSAAYISANPHFCKSALSRYRPSDFIELLDRYGIAWHEKKLGQLFCDDSARQVVDMLLQECDYAGVEIQLNTSVKQVRRENTYMVETNRGVISAESLVIATGGLSIPKMGASGFGYDVARQFSLKIIPTRPALVPFILNDKDQQRFSALSGISVDASVSIGKTDFRENILFTHKGLSGPAILQISSYWKKGEAVLIKMLPDMDLRSWLISQKQSSGGRQIQNILANILPKRLVETFCSIHGVGGALKQQNDQQLGKIADIFQQWVVRPQTTAGYRLAEVTAGGVDTDELSSKTMEAKNMPGLYFIGEVVDVTGHLGGYNFQWAWSSGFCAGQYV